MRVTKLLLATEWKFGHLEGMRFEVFSTVKIQVEVFWVVTPCNVMAGYLRVTTASQPRRPPLEF
jgi:hypothetical protein